MSSRFDSRRSGVEVNVRGGPVAAEFDDAVGPSLRQERCEVYAHFLQRAEVLSRALFGLPVNFLLGFGVSAALFAACSPLGFLVPRVGFLTLFDHL